MKTLFSTLEVHPRDRFDFWHRAAEREIIPHEAQPAQRETFSAELRRAELADIGLVIFETAAMDVAHDVRHIGPFEEEAFVMRQIGGSMIARQDGREAVLQPGDITLLDPSAPYDIRFSPDTHVLLLKIDRAALEARLGALRAFRAVRLPWSTGLHGFLSDALGSLPRHVDALSGAAADSVRNQIVDLVSQSLSAETDGDRVRQSSARAQALARLRAALEARLNDSDLDPEQLARAAGLSPRYANALLQTQGTSLGRLIRDTRLARCRTALADPAQNHRTISEIAFGWGFNDLTHFGKAFGVAFGAAPRAFRQARTAERPARLEAEA